MIPSDRASPSFAATATAIVSAWTSKPTNFILFIDRLLSHVALRCDLPIHSVTHGLRIGAGRSIVTTGEKATATEISHFRFDISDRGDGNGERKTKAQR